MPLIQRLAAAMAFTLPPSLAFAHHPGGGAAPQSPLDGLLSGFAHPVIGLDHLAFVVGVGLLAAMTPHRRAAPLVFVAATVLGTLVHLMAIDLPAAEFVIALSVAAIGALALSGRPMGLAPTAGLFALAGLFHGYAYGEAVVGSQTSAVLAYLVGFAAIQYAVSLAAGHAAVKLFGRDQPFARNLGLRISGGVVAGAGAIILGEQLLGLAGLG